MKWMRNRFLLLPYLVLLTVLAVVGCTSKEDPSEVLPICGNHSCGDLVMVTTDTSSDGFHYLNPSMSPDGTRILFTADWWAIPSDPRYAGDDEWVNNRQMIIMDNVGGSLPKETLLDQNAELVFLLQRGVPFAGGSPFLATMHDDDKFAPIWQDDTHLIFSMRSVEINSQYRLCRADITTPELAPVEFLFMEPIDDTNAPQFIQHMEAALSPLPAAPAAADERWLAFTRSGCVIPDSFETCTGMEIWVLDMTTAGDNDGYDALTYQVTSEYSRLENPRFSPDGTKLIFSGGMDVAGSTGSGTEIFTMDFDPAGLVAGTTGVDNNLQRLTYTSRAEGDPISGILNYSPVYSLDGSTVYFVSTRRAPAVTLHARNVWRVPADGTQEPEIHFFSRFDNVDPTILPDGRMLMSSGMGFPTEMLDVLEDQAYQDAIADSTLNLDEIQYRALAADKRHQLELFEGVMSHIFIYRP